MYKPNHFIFKVLKAVAWVIFIGLCIDTGGLLVNFIISLFKPELVQNLYQKLDLSQIYTKSTWAYYCVYSLIITLSVLKAYLFYIVIRMMLKMDLVKPFNAYVAKQISYMSYLTISIGLLSYIGAQFAKSLTNNGFATDNLQSFWNDSQAFIIMSAIIYIIATIFQKGIALQNESDLTI